MLAEEIIQVTPLVKRITAGNSSVFTGPGTNTYIVGNKEDLTVVDPGPAIKDHIEAIISSSFFFRKLIVRVFLNYEAFFFSSSPIIW